MADYNKYASVDLDAWDKGLSKVYDNDKIHDRYEKIRATTMEQTFIARGFNIVEIRIIKDVFKEKQIDIEKIYGEAVQT